MREFTCCRLSGCRSAIVYVEMCHFLPEQIVQKCFTKGVRCPGTCNADAQRSNVSNDKSADKQIYKVEDEELDFVFELRVAVLASDIVVERTR